MVAQNRKIRAKRIFNAGVLLLGSVVFTTWFFSIPAAAQSKTNARARLDEHALKARIWHAFRERHDAAVTANVTWERQKTVSATMAASMGRIQVRTRSRNIQDQGDVITAWESCEFILSGDRVRYEYPSFSLANNSQESVVSMIDAFDGERHQGFFSRIEGSPYHYGSVRYLGQFDGWNNVHLFGLSFTLRPLRLEAFGPKPDRWRIEPRPVIIEGKRCLVLSDTLAPDGRTRQIVLDPSLNFVPVRYVNRTRDRVHLRVDIKYSDTTPVKWVPSSWISTFYAGGEESFERSENKSVEAVLNVSVPDETFTIDYPPGTDLTVVGEDREGEQRFLVAENGERILWRQAQAEQISGRTIKWPMLFAGVGVAMLAVALLVWSRRRVAGSS